MKSTFWILIFFMQSVGLLAQPESLPYEQAYNEIKAMLNDQKPVNFKRAVLTVENAYFDGGLDTALIQDWIANLKNLALAYTEANGKGLLYRGRDREKVLIHAAAFQVMMDTLSIARSEDTVYQMPYRYDFEDVSGHFDWTKMFVSKLLNTQTGNCHSLPYLYKILVEELGEETHLSLAPNHVYIKHRCAELGMYNTELTSGSFPIDAWLMASGYIHLDAIRNRLYMEALNDQQSIALCMIDLAQGYRHKYGMGDGSFVLKCCETALEHYPHYINAMLLKTEVLRAQWESLAQERNQALTKAEEAQLNEEVLLAFNHMNALVGKIHDMGYRRMPDDMYLNWLTSLKKEREKYENPKIRSTFKNQ